MFYYLYAVSLAHRSNGKQCQLQGKNKMSIYQDYGFTNRREYLISLADDFGLPVVEVFAIADLLGSSEDFDGLICALEDRSEALN